MICQRIEKGLDLADKNILNNVGPGNDVNGLEKGLEIVMNLAESKLIFFIASLYLDWQFYILDW